MAKRAEGHRLLPPRGCGGGGAAGAGRGRGLADGSAGGGDERADAERPDLGFGRIVASARGTEHVSESGMK